MRIKVLRQNGERKATRWRETRNQKGLRASADMLLKCIGQDLFVVLLLTFVGLCAGGISCCGVAVMLLGSCDTRRMNGSSTGCV